MFCFDVAHIAEEVQALQQSQCELWTKAESIRFHLGYYNDLIERINGAKSCLIVYLRSTKDIHVPLKHFPSDLSEYNITVEKVEHEEDVAAMENWTPNARKRLLSRIKPKQEFMERLEKVPNMTVTFDIDQNC